MVQKAAFIIQTGGKRGPEKPKMAWKQLTDRGGFRERKLSAIDSHDRHALRAGVRSAMRAASQLSGCGCCPCTCTLIENPYDIMTMMCFFSKKGKRKVQGVPQSQTAALPRPQEEEETDKSKQAQTEQTYEKH